MPIDIDVIILSFARDEKLKAITQQGIDTLLASEDPANIKFNILVLESNKALQPHRFKGSDTIYPDEPFGFNRYLNIGIKQTHSRYIALCNNDLIFHMGWASEILKAMNNDPDLMSATPIVQHSIAARVLTRTAQYWRDTSVLLWGGVFFVKREVFDTIGMLDENFKFWYADADYCNTLEKHKIKNCLIPTSRVTHLGSESLKTVNDKDHQELTQLPRFYYAYKWQHHSWIKYKTQTLLFKTKLLLGL